MSIEQLAPSRARGAAASSQDVVVLIGHSHLNAVREGFEARTQRGDVDPAGAAFFAHDVWRTNISYADSAPGGGVQFNPEMLKLFDAALPAGRRRYVGALGGNGHIVFGLTRNPRPFDFVLPEKPDLPLEDGAEIVPYKIVEAALKSSMMVYVWQMVAFRQAIGEPFLCLETPPPSGDDAYVATHLGAYAPDPGNIVTRALRYKIWRTHSALLRHFCEGLGVEFLPVPAQAQDEEGFLRPEFHGPDATHANSLYGELAGRQIEQRLGVRLARFAAFS